MADAELTRLVQAVEAAQLASRALTDEDVAALDRARSTVGSTAAEITSAARLELRSLAHRLWAAVAQGLATSKEGAKCRSLACELFVGSFVSETMPTKDAASLAVHWAFAGRAWMLAEEPQSAQDCFTESAKQWKLQPQRLAPMATQTFIWAAEAHFSQAAYSEAFSSLVQARELIGELISRMPKEQQEAVLNNFLGTCYEQALSHRVAGNAAQASDLLNLALGAAGTVAASSRCRLLRALARLGPCDNGLVHAKQALALSPNSKERVLSFQVILELVVGEGKPPEWPVDPKLAQEAHTAAVGLAKESEATLELCLASCNALLDHGIGVEEVLKILKSRKDIHSDPEKCKALLLYSLQRAAEAVLAERQAPPDGLQRLLPDFEALAASKASWAMDICSLAGRLLSALAAKLWNSGRKTDAARWTQKAAELLSVKPEAAAEAAGCWVSAGQCLRLMGDLDGALVCARQAVQVSEDAEAQLLCLELSCEQVKAGHETTEAFLCMQKLHKQPSLRRSQAARAAEAVQKQPSEELTLAGWELFVMCTAKEESGSNSDLCGLTVAAQLVTRAAELQKPSEELQRLLALASQAADACRAPLMAELRSGSGAGSWAIRQLVLVAWSQGQALGRSGQWSWSSAMFAAGHQLLASCEAPPPVPPSPAPDRSSARAREFVDARAWCLISDASAQLQQAKEDGGSLKGAMALLEKAHRLCQRSRELEKQGIHGEVPFSSAASCQRRFLILVLLEFEVRCLEGVAEQELRCFVDEATSSERLSVKCLLALSKIAASQSRRRLAIHCLQSYLIRSTGGSDPDFEQILPAYREILSLHACRNDCLEVFDGILNVLKSKSVNVSDEREKPCVKDEIQWLVATAWNNGAHFFRLQHYRWAEEWMKKSLALAKFSPGLPSEKMTEGYMACLKHCT